MFFPHARRRKKEGNELGSVTTQLKLAAPDGKRRLSNILAVLQTYFQRMNMR